MSGITPWVRAGGGCLGLAVLLLLFQSYFLSVGVSPRIGFKESEELLEKQAKQHHRTVRERFLNVTLPIQVDPKITAILDEAFFVKTCDSETRGIAFIPTRNGLGAHFIMMGGGVNHALATNRMLYSRNPDPEYLYTFKDPCIHGIYCFFHPPTWCTEAEIDARSQAAQTARINGWAWVGQTRKSVKVAPMNVPNINKEGERLVLIFPDYHDWHIVPMKDWSTSLYMPPQFISEEARPAWQMARFAKDLSGLKNLTGGLKGASKQLLWWRSGLLAYIFQPLPWIMDIIHQRINETGLFDNSSAIGIHVRRGDKKKIDGPEPRPLKLYLDLASELRELYKVKKIYIFSDDSNQMKLEMKGQEADWEYYIQESGMQGFTQQSLLIRERSMKDIGISAIVDVWMLSQCKYLVLAMDSWYAEMAYMLSFARGHLVEARHPDGKHFNIGDTNGVVGWHNFVP